MNDPNLNLSFRGFVYSVLAVSDPEIQRLFSEIELQGFNILQDLKSFMTDIEKLKLNAGVKGIDQAKLTEFEMKIKAWVINNYALTDLSNVTDISILNKLKNVDGEGSGLDADLLDGNDSTYFAIADPIRLSSGDLNTFLTNGNFNLYTSSNYSNIPSWFNSTQIVFLEVMTYEDFTFQKLSNSRYANEEHISFRYYYEGSWTPWRELYHTGNIGVGSGLYQDQLKTYLYATGSGGDTGATKNTWTLIPFVDNQVSRGGSINHPGDNRFTVNNTGLYHISVQIPFNTQPDGSDTRISMHKNGTTLLNSDMPSGKAGGNPSPNISIDIQLTAGDYLEFYGWTSGGGNFSGDPHWKFVSITWIGE